MAGTSIEFALSQHCGGDDIVTPIRDDIERADLGVWPRNFMRLPRLEDEYRAIVAAHDPVRLLRAQHEMRRDMLFWDHIPARQIRDRIGPDAWDGAYKFSVVRNPYEFAVSLLFFEMSERGVPAASRDSVRKVFPLLFRGPRNLDLISIRGGIAVDHVLRYERLQDDLRALGAIIGLDISNSLPRLKAGIRPADATVDGVLGAWPRRLVRWHWRRELAAFGYKP